MTKRKGSRSITVKGIDYSWYRGRSVTEIRNLQTNKAIHVQNDKLTTEFCELCRCRIERCGTSHGVSVTLPSAVASYIAHNIP